MFKDFRDFAMKGNVLDLAVGVIVGAAFGKIVSSLVADVLMPLVGVLLGRLDLSGLALVIGEVTVAYGRFLQSVVDFLVVAFCVFLLVRQANKVRKMSEPPTTGEPTADVRLLTEIRDLLRK